jgi:hypothetical protein
LGFFHNVHIFHYSTCLSSMFSISFHISTYLSSIFFISFHNFLLYFPNFPYHFTFQLTFFHIFQLSAPSPPFYFHYPCHITLLFSTN